MRLRLSIKGDDKIKLNELIDEKIEELKLIIPNNIYGYELYGQERETIEQIVGKLLVEKKKTIATAENCTGGTWLTSLPKLQVVPIIIWVRL